MKNYIFTSDRLGFRNWQESDINKMALINADSKVMEFFPSCIDIKETSRFIHRMQIQFEKTKYCFFAVERLDNSNFIGFIGLMYQNYEISFAPYIDIGWRLAKNEWNKGFATEGALKCLDYAFNTLDLNSVLSVCPITNIQSEKVMRKIGMKPIKTFLHPLLKEHPTLQKCILYEIKG